MRSSCDHSPSANPRLEGRCVKCGMEAPRRRMPDVGPSRPFVPDLASDHGPFWTSAATGRAIDRTTGKDPTRDLGMESEFLSDALTMAHRLTGISNGAYPARVNHRLDVGRERYGDGDFLHKDNLVEVLEETPDLAAYAMLELQRLYHLRDGRDLSTFRLDLVAVAAYGAIADWYAQRAARRLRGLE